MALVGRLAQQRRRHIARPHPRLMQFRSLRISTRTTWTTSRSMTNSTWTTSISIPPKTHTHPCTTCLPSLRRRVLRCKWLSHATSRNPRQRSARRSGRHATERTASSSTSSRCLLCWPRRASATAGAMTRNCARRSSTLSPTTSCTSSTPSTPSASRSAGSACAYSRRSCTTSCAGGHRGSGCMRRSRPRVRGASRAKTCCSARPFPRTPGSTAG